MGVDSHIVGSSTAAGIPLEVDSGKMLVECVMYVDVLQVPSVLSQSLQENDIDIVENIKQVLKAVSTLQSLAKKDPQLWSTGNLVLERISEEGDQKVYQGSTLTHFSDSMLSLCSNQALADLQKLDNKIKERLAWSDADLRSIPVFLDTRSWVTQRQVAGYQAVKKSERKNTTTSLRSR